MKVEKIVVLTAFLLLFGTWAYADDCGGGWRYADNLDGTITDCRTGLIWLKDANCKDSLGGINKSNGTLNWHDAKKWAAALSSGHCGLNDGSDAGDWRLPTITEWMAMVAGARSKQFTNPALTDWTGAAKWTNGNPFYNVFSSFYASSNMWPLGIYPLGMELSDGDVVLFDGPALVWPVRAGQVAGNDASFGTVTLE